MMSDKITFMKKDDLLARIHTERAAFAALWDGLSQEQMLQRPSVQEDWSVKDLIAHIIWWENHMLENVIAAKSGADYHMVDDIDAQNVDVFNAHKDHDLADVLSSFEANLARLEEHIGALTEEQINTIQLPTYPLLEQIIGDTFAHYKAHRADLERYVSQVKSG
ncbi:MAG: ClbS/DfsB family four-helix bundle protein [Anaerolineae bacterium]|nr:ClbS/DfsB family four-helix bundle protein [Anaerolineae bacterium]MDQ7033953.1 ClbS/DfsB family four-helix bundle protein [Anaerolineae bacterium]